MKKKGSLIIISGFAGTGKGTLVKKLIELYNGEYMLSVSATTRSPRPGEVEGRDYFFKTREEFDRMAEHGELLEYATFVDNSYGTPAAFVEEQRDRGVNVILEIEIQGAMKVREKVPDAILIFLLPPDADELERRLRGRGTETDEVIRRRLSRAYDESMGIESYDYVAVNDDIEACTKRVHDIISVAAASPLRQKEFIQKLRDGLSRFK
jgi:guanylate kinase